MTPSERGADRGHGAAMFTIEMLPARNGDALWIEYGNPENPSRILIDCGRTDTADILLERMAIGEKPHFELFVMTHIDADHVGGAIRLLADVNLDAEFDDVWFNGWRQIHRYLSVRQGEEFSTALLDRELPWNEAFSDGRNVHPRPVVIPRSGPLPEVVLPGGMVLTLLSPTIQDLKRLAARWRSQRLDLKRRGLLSGKRPPAVEDPASLDLEKLAAHKAKRDPSAPNGSSIAFLAEYGGRSALFTGDAHVGVLVASIKKLLRQRDEQSQCLSVDVLKMSHHGSKDAQTKALLDLIDCPRYLVSSNGEGHYHPHREAIARTILWGGDRPRIYFNYRTEFNSYWGDDDLQRLHGYEAIYAEHDGDSVTVSLFD